MVNRRNGGETNRVRITYRARFKLCSPQALVSESVSDTRAPERGTPATTRERRARMVAFDPDCAASPAFAAATLGVGRYRNRGPCPAAPFPSGNLL